MLKQFSVKCSAHPQSYFLKSGLYNYSTVNRIFLKIITTKKLFIILVYMLLCNNVLHPNAQSCSLCKLKHLPPERDPSANYEEFIFEHQVTRQEAIDELLKLNRSFFEGPSSSTCKSITCTANVMEYCHGPQFINDHCWCELGHANEGLPFIPHICYVGEKQYKASVGSCFFYEEVKECCCAPSLAKQWKHISGGTTVTAFPPILFLTLGVLLKY